MKSILSEVLRRKDGVERRNGRAGALRIEFIERSRNEPPDGTFINESFIEKDTLGSGSVWDIAFSRDPEQKYIFLADGENDRVHILDRKSLDVLTSFGEGGRQPGEFYGVHSIATDSNGNIFTTETYRGQRVPGIRGVAGSFFPKIRQKANVEDER